MRSGTHSLPTGGLETFIVCDLGMTCWYFVVLENIRLIHLRFYVLNCSLLNSWK